MKAVKFMSPISSFGSRKPRVDGESVRDLNVAEQGLVNDDAFLPRKPEPVWIRLRQVLCGTARKPLPKAPPPSPYIAPKRSFHAYPAMRKRLVEAANKCVAEMIDDRERQARNARLGFKSKARDLDVVVGPIFFFSEMPQMWLAEPPVDCRYTKAEDFETIDVAEPMFDANNDVCWGQSAGFEHMSEAIERLRRWCGKNGLENLRVAFDTSGEPAIVNGQARYRVCSMWMHTDAPDISASFAEPPDFRI